MSKKKPLRKRRHKVWQLQEAKSQFSKLVNEVVLDGYHTITKNGEPIVVVISKQEFEKLSCKQQNIVDFFSNSPYQDVEIILERNKDLGRDIDI